MIKLSEKAPSWEWTSVSEALAEMISNDAEEDFVEKWGHHAKINSDYTKQTTKNKAYSAPWTARLCDMIESIRKEFDNQKFMADLTEIFTKNFESK